MLQVSVLLVKISRPSFRQDFSFFPTTCAAMLWLSGMVQGSSWEKDILVVKFSMFSTSSFSIQQQAIYFLRDSQSLQLYLTCAMRIIYLKGEELNQGRVFCKKMCHAGGELTMHRRNTAFAAGCRTPKYWKSVRAIRQLGLFSI